MALQAIKPRIWPGIVEAVAAGPLISADIAMTAAGHYTCPVMQAWRDMTITHMGFYPQAATGSPTGTWTIETVSTTTGLPTGTLWNASGGGSTVTTGTLVAGTWVLSALAASAVITRGSWFAAKFAMASGTTLSSGKISSFGGLSNLPYRANSTGSPAKAVTIPQLLALGDSATTFIPFDQLWPITAWTANSFNNTSSAKRGVRFQVPFACRATGVRTIQGLGGDYNILITNDAGTDLGSTSILVDKDLFMASTGYSNVFFTTPAVLSPGTSYRLVIEPTSATNCQSIVMTLPTADYRSGMPGGTNYTYTAYTGTWDDSQTTLVPAMDLIIDQLDDGAGGGSVARSSLHDIGEGIAA